MEGPRRRSAASSLNTGPICYVLSFPLIKEMRNDNSYCPLAHGWLVWCFDPEWEPTLIRDWQYILTPSGEFARQAMHGELK